MRMLAYKADHDIIDYLQYNEYYIIDETEEFKEAVYHLKVRFYNLVLIFENCSQACTNFLRTIYNENTAFVILTDNVCPKFELKCLKNGAIDVIKEPIHIDLLIARLETIHRKNFSNSIILEDLLFFDKEYKSILSNKQKELSISGKSFDIFSYLVQNKHRVVSKEELIQVTWEEPEMINPNLVEVHISILRSQLKKHLNMELIHTIRNKGYKIRTA